MKNPENMDRFVELDVGVNTWSQDPPQVAVARPARCLNCNAPGVDESARKVVLHGHGLRKRTPLGPLDAEGKAIEHELLLRRYECQRCDAVHTVGPWGLLARRHYSAKALALALWLWPVRRLTDPEVRRRTSPREDEGLSRPERWTTLRRWAQAIRDSRLWPEASIDPAWSLRDCAGRVARMIWSRGSADLDTDEGRVLCGAALAR